MAAAPAPTRMGAGVDSADDALLTRANAEGAIMMIGRALLIAVIVLILLGELYATSIVATPHEESDPTATITKETHLSVADGEVVSLNVTADHYYDNGTHAETVFNASDGSVLTEGTDYEFYTNGTFKNTLGHTEDFNVTYSYYQQNTFQALTSTFASYGETAYIMVGLGLIALGASIALSYFGGFSSRGGR